MRRAPSNDPVPDIGPCHDEPELCELQSSGRKKTTAQWPPEWLIPIVEYAWRKRGRGEDNLDDS
jgi:hypothetical protein